MLDNLRYLWISQDCGRWLQPQGSLIYTSYTRPLWPAVWPTGVAYVLTLWLDMLFSVFSPIKVFTALGESPFKTLFPSFWEFLINKGVPPQDDNTSGVMALGVLWLITSLAHESLGLTSGIITVFESVEATCLQWGWEAWGCQESGCRMLVMELLAVMGKEREEFTGRPMPFWSTHALGNTTG